MNKQKSLQHYRMKRALLTLDYYTIARQADWSLVSISALRRASEEFFGERLSYLYGSKDLDSLITFFQTWPAVSICSSSTGVDIEVHNCPYFNAAESLCESENLAALSSLLCLEDSLVQGYNPDLKLLHRECMLRGDRSCRFSIIDSSDAGRMQNIQLPYWRREYELAVAGVSFAALATRYAIDLMNLGNIKSDEISVDSALRIRYQSACEAGKLLAQKAESTDLEGLKVYYWSKFPHVQCSYEGSVLVCRTDSCALVTGINELGLDINVKPEFSETACICDRAAVEGFNPAIGFKQTKNLIQGDSCCHWEFSLEHSS